jgi:hypothetical protein
LLRGVQEPVPLFPEFYIFALKQATAMAIMGVKAITSFPISTCGVPVLLCLFANKKRKFIVCDVDKVRTCAAEAMRCLILIGIQVSPINHSGTTE